MKLSDLTGPTPTKPTLSSIQSEIFSQRCVGCHTGNGRFLPGIMNLTEGNSYASLVGVA
jgi:mono/diheme cytochrome c family protein